MEITQIPVSKTTMLIRRPVAEVVQKGLCPGLVYGPSYV
jgi:CO dehydrogenase/acetyl-CoA synthase epsilon subunit